MSSTNVDNLKLVMDLLTRPLNSFVGECQLSFVDCCTRIRDNWTTFSGKDYSRSFDRAIQIYDMVSHGKVSPAKYKRYVEYLKNVALLIARKDLKVKILHLSVFKRSFESLLEFVEGPIFIDFTGRSNYWIHLMQTASKCFREGQWSNAVAKYTDAIGMDLRNGEIYANRAVCEIHGGDLNSALEDAEEAVELDPKCIEYYQILAEVHIRKGLHAMALETCTKGLELDASDKTLNMLAALCSSNLEELKFDDDDMPSRTIPANFSGPFELLEFFENRPCPNLSLTEVEQLRSERSDAAQTFLEAVDRFQEAHRLLVDDKLIESIHTLIESRQFDYPICDYHLFVAAAHTVLVDNPFNHKALFVIALFSVDHHLREKYQLIDRCLQLDPTVAEYHFALGCIYASSKMYDRALSAIEDALFFGPHVDWLFAKAHVQQAFPSSIDEAIETLETFLTWAPVGHRRVPEACYSMGLLHFSKSNREQARTFYRKGKEAEDSSVRLAIFGSLEHYVPKRILEIYLES